MTLLTTAQAAQILRLTPDTVRYLARKKRLVNIIVGRNQRLFKRADVQRLARERRIAADAKNRGEATEQKLAG